jgi:hypothetical protein
MALQHQTGRIERDEAAGAQRCRSAETRGDDRGLDPDQRPDRARGLAQGGADTIAEAGEMVDTPHVRHEQQDVEIKWHQSERLAQKLQIAREDGIVRLRPVGKARAMGQQRAPPTLGLVLATGAGSKSGNPS